LGGLGNTTATDDDAVDTADDADCNSDNDDVEKSKNATELELTVLCSSDVEAWTP